MKQESEAPSPIKLLDLEPEIEELWDPILGAVRRVLKSGRFILGPEVEAFESEVADFLDVKHVLGVGSGTDALVLALRALEVGPGDEVITTPFTFVATAEAISTVGAQPVFVDIQPSTFNIDPGLIESAITPRTKVLLPVHLFGLACDMLEIQRIAADHDLAVVEDVAQAFGGRFQGQRLGTIGHVGAFSLFPSKNLGGFGDGGVIATNDDSIAEAVGKLRSHGGRNKYVAEILGYNSRLDELQAAMLRVKLPYIDRWNAQRVEVADRYREALRSVPAVIETPESERHVFHQFTVRVQADHRDAIRQRFNRNNIQTAVYYAHPLHTLPPFRNPTVSMPETERAAREVLSLPIGPRLSADSLDRVVSVLAG